MSTHCLRLNGRCYEIGEETSVYDKSNVLGKGIALIASDHESVFTVSNLVRKIRLEGTALKPTPARATVPNDCLGTYVMY